jgi:hypothetical protein
MATPFLANSRYRLKIITPLTGQHGSAIVLDGTINIDEGVVTGATSITSTAFVGDLTGNADTATTLATARNINGVSFNGSAEITVTAAAGTLSGNTLNSSVVTSSLTSVGTIVTGVWNGTAIASAYLDADTAHLTTAQTFTGEKTFGTTTKLNFRDANAYINSPTANDIEIVATTITLDAASDIQLEGNTTVTGDFTVDGDFIVSGDVVTVNTATLSVEDPLIGMLLLEMELTLWILGYGVSTPRMELSTLVCSETLVTLICGSYLLQLATATKLQEQGRR